MTTSPQEILNCFDQLTDTEQVEIAVEILRRLVHFDFPPLTDEDLALNAEDLFIALDQQETGYE